MRKKLFSYLLQFAVLSASGQTIQLQNQWNKNSDTIYIGVENVIKMSGSLKDLLRIESDQAAVKWNGNSFSIFPTYPGTVKIELITTTGKTESAFTSVYFPSLSAVFKDKNGKESSSLKIGDLPQLKGLVVKCSTNNNFFNDFEILSFVVSCNGKSYEFQGASLDNSKELLTLDQGDILHLEKVNLINRRTGFQAQSAYGTELIVK